MERFLNTHIADLKESVKLFFDSDVKCQTVEANKAQVSAEMLLIQHLIKVYQAIDLPKR